MQYANKNANHIALFFFCITNFKRNLFTKKLSIQNQHNCILHDTHDFSPQILITQSSIFQHDFKIYRYLTSIIEEDIRLQSIAHVAALPVIVYLKAVTLT